MILPKVQSGGVLDGVRYYQGTEVPMRQNREIIGFSKPGSIKRDATKHHFEYWIDVSLNQRKGLVEIRCRALCGGDAFDRSRPRVVTGQE